MLRDILGQERAIEILQSALRGGRLHHAWIFHGPAGVGKRTAADAFAAALLDPNTQADLSGWVDADPDGRTARLVANGEHPGLHVVTKELAAYSRDTGTRGRKQITIPVEVIREFLIEPVYLTTQAPTEARARKVFLVDESELMVGPGQNALLKALEEPPPGVVIILITSRMEQLLPTILSRCQRVAFTRLSDEAMDEWLKRRGAEDLNPDHRCWLLRFSQGSPGLAALALEHDLYSWYRELAPRLNAVRKGEYPADTGVTMAKLVDDLAAALVKDRPNASKDAANKAAARYLFILVGEEWRRFMHDDLAAGRSPERAINSIEMIRQAEARLASHANLGLLFDELAIQWIDGSAVPESWFVG